jgi:hypothetical protein
MNCRTARNEIFAERDGGLDPGQLAALADHVDNCPGCRRTRESLAGAIESWRTGVQATVPPDAGREWQDLHRRIRGSAGVGARETAPHRRQLLAWLAMPLGAAAVILALLLSPGANPPTAQFAGRADSVEVSAPDGSVVFVDDASGWVVVWEAQAGAAKI